MTADQDGDVLRVRDLATLVRRAARLWPDRPALRFDQHDIGYTFAELDHLSDHYAAVLDTLGIGYGDRIALVFDNRPDYPLLWLGAAKIGAAVVPVNPRYSVREIVRLLEHAEPALTVTCADYRDLVLAAAGGRYRVAVTDPAPQSEVIHLAGVDVAPAPVRASVYPETLANIQYTSGTTGQPKGCMLSHGYWTTMVRKYADGFPYLGPDDVLLTAQPFYYLDPQWSLAACLLVGSSLVVLDRFHPTSFWDKVRAYGVTYLYCIGMMPTLLLRQPERPTDRAHSLRAVACSGIPKHLHAALEARFGVAWYEGFGMTETGGDLRVLPDDHDELVGTGCVGRPNPHREVRIVDEHGRAVPRGATGELVLRGIGMMDGYYRDEQATRAVFRDGWFHTGDLARMDEYGRVYLTGRLKDMARRSGENIALNEVEAVLTSAGRVSQAACIPVADDLRGEEVQAFLVVGGEADTATTLGEVVAHASANLAPFKVPRYWSLVDELPLTPSQRVAKEKLRALSVPAFDRTTGQHVRLGPSAAPGGHVAERSDG
ncbi:Long-chain-fatty-acid--CoA ligase [Micromonospora sp. MW-13]|uniref:AMP-binding protein n=1 Tax=Micromonospora sp. MW-13 TaxID=2094022 RepID=UPI000E44E594|nr:AMP-binding protein [Micromonospora sp. MW-13]RGC66805.1 Long-chain-fatty-acid--CoA ligase [Micromonospora sp. MW-13]